MTHFFEHTQSISLPATPERAFRALTDPLELRRWFAIHAEVEPRVGGAYRFWGSATLGAPPEPDASQTVTAFEPGRRLSFRWKLHGTPTEVTYRLAPGATSETAKLEVRHAVQGELPYPKPRHVIDDLWRLHTGNLGEYLRAGANIALPDFTSSAPEVRASIEIAAPPAKVFKALLVPELMNQWLGGAAHVDLARREYSYGWHYEVEGKSVAGGPTRILELVENQRIVTDWPDWRGDPGKPSTRVTWLLEPLADGRHTRVTVIHDGFKHPVDRSDYSQGWAGFLEALEKTVLAN